MRFTVNLIYFLLVVQGLLAVSCVTLTFDCLGNERSYVHYSNVFSKDCVLFEKIRVLQFASSKFIGIQYVTVIINATVIFMHHVCKAGLSCCWTMLCFCYSIVDFCTRVSIITCEITNLQPLCVRSKNCSLFLLVRKKFVFIMCNFWI